MQRKYSEPNAYIDNLPKGRVQQEELYDDVDLPDVPAVRCTSWEQHLGKGRPIPWGHPGFCKRQRSGQW